MMAIPIKNGVGVDKALVVRAMMVARPVIDSGDDNGVSPN